MCPKRDKTLNKLRCGGNINSISKGQGKGCLVHFKCQEDFWGLAEKRRGCLTRPGRGGGRGAKGWGFMCLTDWTSQGDDTVHQPAHLSAHLCHYHGLTGVWVVEEHWEINWIKWGWTQRDWAQVFIRIDENRIDAIPDHSWTTAAWTTFPTDAVC